MQTATLATQALITAFHGERIGTVAPQLESIPHLDLSEPGSTEHRQQVLGSIMSVGKPVVEGRLVESSD